MEIEDTGASQVNGTTTENGENNKDNYVKERGKKRKIRGGGSRREKGRGQRREILAHIHKPVM